LNSTVDIREREGRLEQAVRVERPRLFDFIRRRVRTDEDAEDILQDVFYQLAATDDEAGPIEQITSWLFTVARNRIIDWYRKKKPAALPVDGLDDTETSFANLLLDSSQNPEDVYARSLLWEELGEALGDLPEKQREVFVMHEFEGKSFKEIAGLTGEPINTLLSRKRYAVLYLREQLQELYDELFN
jgi:RNA polymerase sigma factor (sigma-70 family)